MKLRVIVPAATAVVAMQSFAQINDTDFQGFAMRGKAMYNDANYLGCIDQMRHAKQLAPSVAIADGLEQVDYYLAMAMLYAGDNGAEDALKQFLVDYPASLLREDVKFSLVNIVFSEHDYITALARYKEIDPGALSPERRSQYWLNCGFCELKTSYYDEARHSYAQLANAKGYENASKFYLAYIDYANNDYAAAAKGFSTVNTAIAPGNMADYYLCQIYYRDGDYNRALTKARELMRSPLPVEEQYVGEANRIAGECLYRLGQQSEAVPYIRRYLETTENPQPSALYIIGLSEYGMGHYEDAVDYLQEVVYDEPDAMVQSSYLYIGQSLAHMGDNDAAIVAFDKALNMPFDKGVQEVAFYNYAVTKFKGGKVPFGDSATTFEEFLRKFPNSRYADQVRGYLVNGYLAEKNYDSALNAINRMQNAGAETLAAKQHVLYCIGARDLASGSTEKALQSLDEAAELAGYNSATAAEVQLLRGEALYNLGRYDQAAQALLDYIDNAPSDAVNRPLALYDLGYTRFRQKRYGDAATDFNRMIAKPGSLSRQLVADAYNRVADCHFYTKDFDAASAAYDKAIVLEPSVADHALFQQGLISGYRRDYAGKISHLNKLIDRYPTSALIPDAMLEITESYLRQGKDNEAIATYRKLIADYPATAQARQGYLQMALTLMNTGQRAQAIQAYKDVVKLYPTSDESAQAVEALKLISAEDGTMNQLAAYLASVNGAPSITPSEAEQLVFEAAEKSYLTEGGIDRLEAYLKQYPADTHTPQALAYLLQEYSQTNHKRAYECASTIVAKYPHSSGASAALAYMAQTNSEKGDYKSALKLWQQLEQSASAPSVLNDARMGIVRSAMKLDLYASAIPAADALLASSTIGAEEKDEVLCLRGLALYHTGDAEKARADWRQISAKTDNVFGAQSAYYLAQSLLDSADLAGARKAAEKLTSSGTPHNYWLARGFILLSDVYTAEGRDFEAREYLKALRENYPGNEPDIFNMIDQRIKK